MLSHSYWICYYANIWWVKPLLSEFGMFDFTKTVCPVIAIHFHVNPTFTDFLNCHIHSRVIFRISSSIFASFPPSIPPHIVGLMYTSVLAFLLFSTNLFSVCSSTAGAMWQHLQQQQQHMAVKTSTTLSQGSREWAQRGRKSQDRNTDGRHTGFFFWKKFISRMMSSRITRGAPTPTSTEHPASDRLNTNSGKRKKQRMM